MAEDNEEIDNEEGEGEETSTGIGGKKKLIILIVAGLLVIGACIGGTLYILGFFDSQEDVVAVEEAVDEKPVINKPPQAMYFPIKPSFVVNFQSRGRQRFLQTDVTLMTRDPEVFTALQSNLPLIKNRLVMLLGGAVYEELQTEEGRELMRQQALDSVKQLMDQEIGKSDIEQVLFTNFVMQ